MDRRSLGLLGAIFVAACSTSAPSTPPAPETPPPGPVPLPIPGPGNVTVDLASVTLANDCGTAPTTAPTRIATGAPAVDPAGHAAGSSTMAADSVERPCRQSSVQLVVSNRTGTSARLRVTSVTVLDRGASIGELRPGKPSRWAGDRYEVWDETVAADASLNVAYALSRPAVFAGMTYTVRVVISTVGGDTTVETQAAVEGPASLPPGVST
jgi:hypothetical protein